MQNPKWYQKNTTVLVSLLTIGPFALPLVWFNPRYRPAVKVALTVAVIAFTAVLTFITAHALKILSEYYGIVFSGGQGL